MLNVASPIIEPSLHAELTRLSTSSFASITSSSASQKDTAAIWDLLSDTVALRPSDFPGLANLFSEIAANKARQEAAAKPKRKNGSRKPQSLHIEFTDEAKMTLFRLARYLSMFDVMRLSGLVAAYKNAASARAASHYIYTEVLKDSRRYSGVSDEEREQISRVVASRASGRPRLIAQNAVMLKPVVAAEPGDDSSEEAEAADAADAAEDDTLDDDVSKPVMQVYRATTNPGTTVPSVQKVTDLKEQALDTRDMAAELLRLRMAGLLRNKKALAEVPLGTLAQVYGITFDKAQIAKGESTENIAVLAKNVDENMSAEDAINLILAQREETQAAKEAGAKSKLRGR